MSQATMASAENVVPLTIPGQGQSPESSEPPQLRRRRSLPRYDPLPSEKWTDTGAAARFAELHSGTVRYVHDWKCWLIWDGKRWARDKTGRVSNGAKQLARQLHRWAADIDDADARKAASRYAYTAESAKGIRAILALAESEPVIAITSADLDADPWLVNCLNGVFDLRTGTLMPHDSARLLTKITAASYLPGAPATEFQRFLADIQPDPEMQIFLRRLFGYGMLGKVTEHVLPIFYGKGRNGKSTLVTAVKGAAGEYAMKAEQELLLARDGAHPTGVADLFGARLAFCSETDSGRRLAEATVKELTGGETLKARRMREDFWEFEPSHTAILSSNYKPLVRGRDEGIWRRLRLVPFEVYITDEQVERVKSDHNGDDLDTVLQRERDGILTWMIDGFADYRENGLTSPEAVREATAGYRKESDAVARFIDQCCLVGPNFYAAAGALWTAYQKWCIAENENPGSQTAFGNELTERGFDREKRGTVIRLGIALSEDEE